MDEDRFPLLAFQYLLSILCSLGRLERRWKDQEHFQDQKEGVLMDRFWPSDRHEVPDGTLL
jgi:hypothetical protein